MIGRALLLSLLLALTGCGLSPMYAGGANSALVQRLSGIEVLPIAGRSGWLVRNALKDRLPGDGGAQYLLQVVLDDRLEGLGLLADETTTRERRTLRARYQLSDAASGTIMLDASAGADAGIDVVSSEYATVAAEERALENLADEVAERIVTRLALELRDPAP